MRNILLLCLIFLTQQISNAQWLQQVSGVNTHLNALYCDIPGRVWVVGDAGVVLKTTDEGLNWNPKTSGTLQNLRDVFFTDSLTGYAAGDSGTVIKTIDGGQNWTSHNAPFDAPLTSVYFLNADTGFVTGEHTILRTNDGGSTWIVQLGPMSGGCCFKLNSVQFVNDSTGYILGYDMPGTILVKSTDAGLTWTGVWTDPEASSDGWWEAKAMVVNGNINQQVMAGKNGKVQHISGSSGYFNMFGTDAGAGNDLNAVCDNTGSWLGTYTAVGENGTIIRYPNSGPANAFQVSGVGSALNDIDFYDQYNGYIAGDSGVILHTSNGGFLLVTETSERQVVNIYPNPSSGTLQVVGLDPGQTVQVHDATGRLVLKVKTNSNTLTINLSVNRGIYICQVVEGNRMISRSRIVID